MGNDALYNSTVNCPVCLKDIEVTKIKSKFIKVSSRDTDFCVYYDNINPLLYDVWVCENCGYAAQQDKFGVVLQRDAKAIRENIMPKWNKHSFTGERTIDNAIETFKLALYNLQVKNAKPSEVAKVCLRIAWLYRIKKDKRENDFLKFAVDSYVKTYEKERFPVDKLDEYTCMYIIGELFRRTENFEESIKWFSRLIGSPNARGSSRLIEMARDQFQLAKEQMEETNSNSSNDDGDNNIEE